MNIKQIIFSATAILCLNLYNPQGASAQSHQKPTAEEMAQKQTSKMKTELALTADQEKQVQALNLKYAQQRLQSEGNKGNADDRSQKDAELKAILTPQQYETWQSKKGQMHERGQGEHSKHQ